MTSKIRLIVIAATLALSSCTVRGVCTDKTHIPRTVAETRVHYGHTSIPVDVYEDEKWTIDVRTRHHTRTLKVSKELYDAVEEGDTIRWSDGYATIRKQKDN